MKWNKLYLLALLLMLMTTLTAFACGDDDDDDDDTASDDDDTESDDDTADDDDTVDDDDTADDDDTVDDDDDDVVDPSTLPGKTYYLDMALTDWTEPVGLADIVGYYVPTILLGVKSAGDGAIGFVTTTALDEEEKTIEQNPCLVTTLFDGTLDDAGTFQAGPQDFPMIIFGLNATLYDAFYTGTFLADGSGFLDASFGGNVDIRQVIDFFYYDADTICTMAETFGTPCQPCPEDSEEYCVGIKSEAFSGVEISGMTIEEIGPDDIGEECEEE